MHVQRMVLLPDDFDVDVDGCMGLATDHGVDRADWADLLRTFAANGERVVGFLVGYVEPDVPAVAAMYFDAKGTFWHSAPLLGPAALETCRNFSIGQATK